MTSFAITAYLLRLPTTGSAEESRIRNALDDAEMPKNPEPITAVEL